jgi:CheY-like chemotaxis protein
VASLTVAKQTKGLDRSSANELEIDNVVRSVESAVALVQKGAPHPDVLWVDDRPTNNVYERKAMEAVGIRFTLSEDTTDALDLLAKRSFAAVISDMGRREGPREGYVLLDAMRAKGDNTPLFFFASSNAPEHKLETSEHGGQGCTNDGQELFDMVTKSVFGPRQARRKTSPIRRAPRDRRELA